MLSDPGRARRNNEDACAASGEHGVFVVCDGVGGAASGEVASRIAADAILSKMVSTQATGTSPGLALQGAVEHVNRLVHRQARQSTVQRGMATTLVALVFDPGLNPPLNTAIQADEAAGTVWLANVGDSRCYRLRDDYLEQLTHDHSVVEEQVRSGEMTRAQANASPIRNVITRAVGSEASVDPDIHRLPAHHGDLYLLCSDGLTRDLSDSEIATEIAAIPRQQPYPDDDSLARACDRLIRAANEKGGGDNITCLLVYIA